MSPWGPESGLRAYSAVLEFLSPGMILSISALDSDGQGQCKLLASGTFNSD